MNYNDFVPPYIQIRSGPDVHLNDLSIHSFQTTLAERLRVLFRLDDDVSFYLVNLDNSPHIRFVFGPIGGCRKGLISVEFNNYSYVLAIRLDSGVEPKRIQYNPKIKPETIYFEWGGKESSSEPGSTTVWEFSVRRMSELMMMLKIIRNMDDLKRGCRRGSKAVVDRTPFQEAMERARGLEAVDPEEWSPRRDWVEDEEPSPPLNQSVFVPEICKFEILNA